MLRGTIVLFMMTVALMGCQSTGNIKPLTEADMEQAEYAEDIARLNQQSDWLYQEFKSKGLLYRDAESNDYIKALARRLAPEFDSQGIEIRVFLVKNATPNAIALPNGDIYVFSGLMALVQNQDQLASIVAHEIGHVIHRHGLKSAINQRNTIVTAHITNIFLFGTGLAYLPAGASLASFSRDMEQEADQLSLEYLHSAGFDVSQSPAVFERFTTLPTANSIAGSIYSSHPDNQARIAYLNQRIQTDFTPPHPLQPSDQFEQVRARMVELNVKLRLRAKQYQLALRLLDEAEAYYQQQEKITYYRGEVYRQMADNPEAAAKEHAWLQERNMREEDKVLYQQKVVEHRAKARENFTSIEASDTAPKELFRGLGMICNQEGDAAGAAAHFQKYLDQPTPPKDRLFIQHQIELLNKQLGK